MDRLAAFAPHILSVLRIMTALLFLEHGTMKILGFPVPPEPHPFHFFTMAGLSGVLELVGGLLLTLGLFTRITAFVVCGEMAVAYFTAHAPRSFFPMQNMGEPAILFCFIFLYLTFAGPGEWSLDSLRRKNAAGV